eukprot:6585808-Prymnesium_polylepis.1
MRAWRGVAWRGVVWRGAQFKNTWKHVRRAWLVGPVVRCVKGVRTQNCCNTSSEESGSREKN